MPKVKRGGTKRSGGGSQGASSNTLTIGNDTIEFDGKLEYGPKQNATSDQRKGLDAWENKRYGNKIEFAISIDADGRPLQGEVRGGSHSVRTPRWWGDSTTAILTHNHPRENGGLGGTFSDEDIYNFIRGNNKGKRATAKEGTYWISRMQLFNGAGLRTYVKNTWQKNQDQLKAVRKQLNQDAADNKISKAEYDKKWQKSFNNYLIGLHNDLIAGQEKYGYTYGLEKRK